MLARTLLFLGAVGLHRTWDLRGYTGAALALLSGRRRAGYRHAERFLTEVAAGDGAPTSSPPPWRPGRPGCGGRLGAPPRPPPATISMAIARRSTPPLIPQGLVGHAWVRCRAAASSCCCTTSRGTPCWPPPTAAIYLTAGVPALIRAYERPDPAPTASPAWSSTGRAGGEFLATLAAAGCTVVTVLQADQYTGLASFTRTSALSCRSTLPGRAGGGGRRPARFRLSRPAHPEAPLALCVALVRDHRRRIPARGG